MSYLVTVTSGEKTIFSYPCSGPNDQVALIYAGKIIEANRGAHDPNARVTITRDGLAIGPICSVGEMLTGVPIQQLNEQTK